MAELNLTENEYERMPSERVAATANLMLEEMEIKGERAVAIAIALRDRIEAEEETNRDPTACVLAQILVGELEAAKERAVMQCVATLLSRANVKQEVAA